MAWSLQKSSDMGSVRVLLVLAVIAALGTGARAAGGGATPKPRLGTFTGLRHEDATTAGRKEPSTTATQTTTFRVSKGRLYVTVRPPNHRRRTNPWRQSFKILSDEWQDDRRVIVYERDAHPVARRNNERSIAATWGGGASLHDMAGTGSVIVNRFALRWHNMGDGELRFTQGPRQIGARYDWVESFVSSRKLPATAPPR